MSFSVTDLISGLEYNGHTLNTLFAQRSNLFRPEFYRLLNGIVAQQCRESGVNQWRRRYQKTLGEFLGELQLSDDVARLYLLPMISAIWSSSIADAEQFPLGFFLRFFENHGLLNIADRPQWHTINGGSKSYIPPLVRPFQERLYLNSEITELRRQQDQVPLHFSDGNRVL